MSSPSTSALALAVEDGPPATAPSPDLVRRADAWLVERAARQRVSTQRALSIAADVTGTETTIGPDTATSLAPVASAPTHTHAPATTPPAPAESVSTPPPTNPPTTAAPTTTQAPASVSDEPSAAQWAALRDCESGGRYDSVSANGLYRGAYQFSQATWNSVAVVAYPALVGVDPALASPGEQDALALALWRVSGIGAWPNCGGRLL